MISLARRGRGFLGQAAESRRWKRKRKRSGQPYGATWQKLPGVNVMTAIVNGADHAPLRPDGIIARDPRAFP